MSQLTSDFAQLPGTNDPDWIDIYQAVYSQLEAMGLPMPPQPPTVIGRDVLLLHLQKTAGKIIKAELDKTDRPDYSGKSDQEQADLLNDWAEENGDAPPVNRQLVGLPFAPNALTSDDVKESKLNNAAAKRVR